MKLCQKNLSKLLFPKIIKSYSIPFYRQLKKILNRDLQNVVLKMHTNSRSWTDYFLHHRKARENTRCLPPTEILKDLIQEKDSTNSDGLWEENHNRRRNTRTVSESIAIPYNTRKRRVNSLLQHFFPKSKHHIQNAFAYVIFMPRCTELNIV